MALTLISTPLDITVDDTAVSSVTITSGIDSTYDSYEFHFVNMHPSNQYRQLQFQVNAAGASGFNETITSTYFQSYHVENTTTATLYYVGYGQAQGTAYQVIGGSSGFDNDQSTSGVLTLYAPSSTTYVKHFTSRASTTDYAPASNDVHVAGYINTTAAIDEISFKFSANNIDAGTIKMFGVS